jgi:hypothetical protein
MSLINKIKELFEKIPCNDVKTDCGKVIRFSVDGVSEITEDGLEVIKNGLFFSGEDSFYIKDGELIEGLNFYDVFLKDGPAAHIISKESGKINEGDKLTIGGLEAGPGEYVINDGRILFVKEDGVIEKIKTKKEIMANKKRFSATKKFEDAEAMEIMEVTIVADELVEGGSAIVIDESLNVDEAYTGELEVDGMTVAIDAGVISSVAAEEFVEEAVEEAVEEVVEEMSTEVEEVVEELSAVETRVEELFSKIEGLEKINLELSEKVAELLGEPSEEKTNTKLDFKKSSRASKIDFFKK